MVAHAILLGLTVSCPGCGTRTIKDDQCMHMDSCACRVSFCYVCGGKAADCRRGEGCDVRSLYLERNPGWREFGDGDGCLVEFHRRKVAAMLQVARQLLGPELWAVLQRAEPGILTIR